jgi:predicted nucleotidyltransferase
VNENFLNIEKIGKTWRITANQKHLYFITRKIPYNLQLVYGSNIVEHVYKAIPNAKAIILFGSYRWGSDNENSDVDIAVEVLNNEELRIFTLGIIKEFGLRKNIKINLHIFSKNKIDLNLLANIANGIILDGFFEVKI